MHVGGNIVAKMVVRGRQFGSSCWLSSQKLTAISPVARCNFRFMLVWRLRNKKELLDGLLYELSALFPLPILYEMYEEAINDQDYSFWFIDLVAKKKDDMMFVRFSKKMIVDTNDVADPARLEDSPILRQ